MMETVKLGRDLDLHKTWWVGGIVWALKSTASDGEVKPAMADLLNDAAKEIESLRSALASEREACAKLAEEYWRRPSYEAFTDPQRVTLHIATLIRGRGEP